MAGKWPKIPDELTDNYKLMSDLFKELKEFAEDPEKPTPDFHKYIELLSYPDMIGYTTWHGPDNPSFGNGAVQDIIHRFEALKREDKLRRKTLKDFYEGNPGYVTEEKTYLDYIKGQNTSYISGTHPRQAGKGNV